MPHEWFAYLRQHAPVYWHPMATSPRGGFWCVTGYDDCVTVNRDWEHFGSSASDRCSRTGTRPTSSSSA